MNYIINENCILDKEFLKVLFTEDNVNFYFEGNIKMYDLSESDLRSAARAKAIPSLKESFITVEVLYELGYVLSFEKLSQGSKNTYVRSSKEEIERDLSIELESIHISELIGKYNYSENKHANYNYKRNLYKFTNVYLAYILKWIPITLMLIIGLNVAFQGAVLDVITYWSIIPIVLGVSMLAFMIKCRYPLSYAITEIILGFIISFIVFNYYNTASYSELGQILTIISGVIIVSKGFKNLDSSIEHIQSNFIRRNWYKVFYGTWTKP